jgi:uncharacterized membrane protein YphA (DoxX/SURF4 family)
VSAAPGGLFRRLDDSGWPLLGARLVLGGSFLWLGANKVSDPVAFLKLIREYDLVPVGTPWLLNGMAAVLPWLEIWVGVLLLLGLAVRGAAVVMGLMLVVFTTAITLRALDIQAASELAFCAIKFDCGCGSGEEYVCTKLPQNLGLLCLAGLALWSRSRRYCVGRGGLS